MQSVSNYVQNSNFATVFLDASLKSFLILALAGGWCLCWRRASAATRHLIWFLAVASLAAWPLFTTILPSWGRPLWSVSTNFNSGNQFSLALEFAPFKRFGFSATEAQTSPTGTGTSSVSGASSGSSPRLTTHFSTWWLVAALATWLTGVVLILFFVVLGQFRLRLLRRRTRALGSADWTPLVCQLCEELDVRRAVTLLWSVDNVMPMTWGGWRPVVLLPAQADQWPMERRRVVLFRELAHVKRWDCLTRMITRIVCAIHWFNPLVWVAARRMRVEQECACDDLVLNSGWKASEYASHLVEIARTFRRLGQGAGIATAQPSGLERRVTVILDDHRNRNSIGKLTVALVALVIAGFGLLLGGCATTNRHASRPWSIEQSEASAQLKHFVAEKEAQARAAAKAEGTEMLPEFKTLFAAAAKGNWQTISNIFEDLRRRAPQYNYPGSKDERLHGPAWQAVLEIWGTFDNIVVGEDKYPAAFGRDIMESILPGSIYFGGTDPGRFLVTALCKSHVKADPFFTLTQNALADRSYLMYLEGMYHGKIYVPTDEDSQNCFHDYLVDVGRRVTENKVKPGENAKWDSGRLQLSGQVAVMQINGLLAKVIFDKNPGREFYIEESFPLDWMYPHLVPHGLIMKIHREPLAELPEGVVRKDHEYWSKYVKPMIGDWLNDDTSAAQLTAFIEKVQLNQDFTGFKGDPRFVQNDYARKMFSKLRSGIGGIYGWRMEHAASASEKDRMSREADFAFRQALALCPYSPEAVFRYANLLKGQNRISEALLVAETAARMPPLQGNEGGPVRDLVKQLRQSEKSR